MTYNNLLCEIKGSNFWITINRADKLNALNIETLQEIKQAVLFANGLENVRTILLTGSGEKAFAAGADIAEFANFSVAEGTQMAASGHEVMNTVEQSAKPVIALVNGFALGGGCELAMACHIRIAAEHAKFGQPEVNLGLIPGYAGTQRLCQLIGKAKATELLLTADIIKADSALQLGLVTQVVPMADLHSTGEALAEKMGQKAPLALARIIACVNEHYTTGKDGFAREIEEFGLSFGTDDFKEGTQAFLNKGKANFSGK